MQKTEFNMGILYSCKLRELDAFIEAEDNPQGRIINILHEAQKLFSYLPQELQLYIARKINMPARRLTALSVLFVLSQEPSGKYIIEVWAPLGQSAELCSGLHREPD